MANIQKRQTRPRVNYRSREFRNMLARGLRSGLSTEEIRQQFELDIEVDRLHNYFKQLMKEIEYINENQDVITPEAIQRVQNANVDTKLLSQLQALLTIREDYESGGIDFASDQTLSLRKSRKATIVDFMDLDQVRQLFS